MSGLRKFYLANRSLPAWWVSLSIAASWFGAASTLATLEAVASRGLNGLWDIVIPSIGSLLVVTFLLGPKIIHWTQAPENANALSMAAAVENTYGAVGRWVFATIIVLATTTMLAAQLIAAGGIVQTLTQWPSDITVVAIAVVVGIYAAFGGYRAVVISDLAQLLLISLGLLVPLGVYLVSHQAAGMFMGGGGLSSADSLVPSASQFGTAITFIGGWVVAPEMWQRLQSLSGDDINKTYRRLAWQVVGKAALCLVGLFCLVVTLGIVAGTGNLGLVMQPDQPTGALWGAMALAMPHPALVAIMLIGVLAAIASTMDSSLNVGSLSAMDDVLKPLLGKFMPEKHWLEGFWLMVARWTTVAMMVCAAIIALEFNNILTVMWLSADLYATVMLVPLVAMLFLPTPSYRGGLAAMAAGGLVTLMLRMLPIAGIALPTILGWPWATWWGVGAGLLAYSVVAKLSRRKAGIERLG